MELITKGDFRKYPDIENYFSTEAVAEMKDVIGDSKIPWVVMEKIHGANFQVTYDELGLHCGKRTSYLEATDNFYGFINALPEGIIEKIRRIYEKYDHQPVRLFGELFGGRYDADHKHKDLVKKLCPKCVQREVQYSPFNHVLFYDVAVGTRFLCWKEIEALVKEFGLGAGNIQFEQPLMIRSATIDDILKTDNLFESVIYKTDLAYEELPPIADNVCEGIVIKPYEQEYITRRGNRVIIKSKNEKFSERKRREKPADPEHDRLIADISAPLIEYVTENRFNAVFSKDIWTKKDLGKFLQAYMQDLLRDAEKDKVPLPEDEKIMHEVRKRLNQEIIKFKTKYFSQVSQI